MLLSVYSSPQCYAFDSDNAAEAKQDLLQIKNAALSASRTESVQVDEQEDLLFFATAIHDRKYLSTIRNSSLTATSLTKVGQETFVSRNTWSGLCASAAVVRAAADDLMKGARPFCCIGPGGAGHHAEPQRAMGYNTINWMAVTAHYLHRKHGLERVAIVDISDMHRANGTERTLGGKEGFFCVSAHVLGSAEYPYYSSGEPEPQAQPNVLNVGLPALTNGKAYRRIMESTVFSALHAYRPQAIVNLVGCDGFIGDPTGRLNTGAPFQGLRLSPADLYWSTLRLREVARRHSQGRLLSINGGGYDLDNVLLGIKSFAAAMCDDAPTEILARYANHRTIAR